MVESFKALAVKAEEIIKEGEEEGEGEGGSLCSEKCVGPRTWSNSGLEGLP